ncbi:MAG: hypothetical protein J6R42_04455 [Clostridia bacterium]|nr:hypothetical protein [Clostridia bacterium]
MFTISLPVLHKVGYGRVKVRNGSTFPKNTYFFNFFRIASLYLIYSSCPAFPSLSPKMPLCFLAYSPPNIYALCYEKFLMFV